MLNILQESRSAQLATLAHSHCLLDLIAEHLRDVLLNVCLVFSIFTTLLTVVAFRAAFVVTVTLALFYIITG